MSCSLCLDIVEAQYQGIRCRNCRVSTDVICCERMGERTGFQRVSCWNVMSDPCLCSVRSEGLEFDFGCSFNWWQRERLALSSEGLSLSPPSALRPLFLQTSTAPDLPAGFLAGKVFEHSVVGTVVMMVIWEDGVSISSLRVAPAHLVRILIGTENVRWDSVRIL